MGGKDTLVFKAIAVLGLQGMNSSRTTFRPLPDAPASGLLALLLLRR
jgi:hypothetical protein